MRGSGTEFFKNKTGLANGIYHYNVHAGDAAGNFNTSEARLVTVNVPAQVFNISGFKINDTSGNGAWDAGEQGIQGWNITLRNALTGAEITNTSTDDVGFYQFRNLANGSYNVTEETKYGWTPTSAAFRMTTIAGQDITSLNFTNKKEITSGITVISPNGGENWHSGTRQVIRWTYSSSSGTRVKIELLRGDVVDRIITSRTSIGKGGSGSYNWRIPSTQAPGSDYKIRITSLSNPAYTDASDNNFTIS